MRMSFGKGALATLVGRPLVQTSVVTRIRWVGVGTMAVARVAAALGKPRGGELKQTRGGL